MAQNEILGFARVERATELGFPWGRLVQEDVPLAELGRYSWFNTFIGRGQRIVLSDGTRWRLKAIARRGSVCPVVAVAGGAALARSAPGDRNYGINTRDHGYSLNPGEERRGRARRWMLVEHEDEVAVVTRSPFTVEATQPLHLAVVFLAFGLSAFGVIGDRELVPSNLAWG